jgi:hypothetical protein
MKITLLFLAGAVVIVGATACGSEPAPTAQSPAAGATSSTAASASSPAPSPSAGTFIGVTISEGSVAPTNAEAEAVAGQPIILEVSSDAADSIHVHSIPEHVFAVQARPGQRFEFTVDVPGRVDVELHELNRTIVTITVRP